MTEPTPAEHKRQLRGIHNRVAHTRLYAKWHSESERQDAQMTEGEQ